MLIFLLLETCQVFKERPLDIYDHKGLMPLGDLIIKIITEVTSNI